MEPNRHNFFRWLTARFFESTANIQDLELLRCSLKCHVCVYNCDLFFPFFCKLCYATSDGEFKIELKSFGFFFPQMKKYMDITAKHCAKGQIQFPVPLPLIYLVEADWNQTWVNNASRIVSQLARGHWWIGVLLWTALESLEAFAAEYQRDFGRGFFPSL